MNLTEDERAEWKAFIRDDYDEYETIGEADKDLARAEQEVSYKYDEYAEAEEEVEALRRYRTLLAKKLGPAVRPPAESVTTVPMFWRP